MILDKIHIYGLTEPNSEFVRYVGYAKNLDGRFRSHLKEAAIKAGTHKLYWLRKLFREGKQPGIVTLEVTTVEHRVEREQYWIAKLKLTNNLVNSTKGGDGLIDPTDDVRKRIGRASSLRMKGVPKPYLRGRPLTEETRKRISEALKGNTCGRGGKGVPKSEEHKREIGYGNQGKVRTPEMRIRMSEANKGKQTWLGRKHTEETKAKISASRKGKQPWLGKHHNEATKQKIREAKLGTKASPETKALLSSQRVGNQNALGHIHDSLTRLRMSNSMKNSEKHQAACVASGLKRRGIPQSPEHRAKIAAARRAYFLNLKEAA